MEITVDGQTVQGSPFRACATSPDRNSDQQVADACACSIKGGRIHFDRLQPAETTILVRNALGQACELPAPDSVSFSWSHCQAPAPTCTNLRAGNSSLIASFDSVPAAVGTSDAELDVRIGGVSIFGSPYSVTAECSQNPVCAAATVFQGPRESSAGAECTWIISGRDEDGAQPRQLAWLVDHLVHCRAQHFELVSQCGISSVSDQSERDR